MDVRIEQFLMKLPDNKRNIALTVRDIILEASTKMTEAIKWNQLTFVSDKKNIAFIYTYPKVDYMNLGFLAATSLNDPKKLFEGTGKGMRHIKIYSTKDIPAKQIQKWVKEAITINENFIANP
jgi:hypothetical protein